MSAKRWVVLAAVAVTTMAGGCAKKSVVMEESVTESSGHLDSITVTGTRIVGREAEPAPPPTTDTLADHLSTFSVDVDTGSYSRARVALRAGRWPDGVRSEEFLNYFDHGYLPPATPEVPFSTTLELAPAPWGGGKHLLLVGLKGFEVAAQDLPPANFVFLVDTSGSMEVAAALPLLVQSLRDFSSSLRDQDRVAIVAYAGSAGTVLEPTSGRERARIVDALESLSAGGSTDGAGGIVAAYRLARENFRPGGNNRVILATDGDFNVGLTSRIELDSLIAREASGGIGLTVLGFGDSSLGDRVGEGLADRGNGNYAFIDDGIEADKILRREMGSTLLTIAQDVKVQVEFNPARVRDYRLIGYANRVLEDREFADDRVDAGEIGAGHDVTALYELTLGESAAAPRTEQGADEFARVRLRYKRPGEAQSRLLEHALVRADLATAASPRLRFAAAVAAFGEALAGRAFEGMGYAEIAAVARASRLPDPYRERDELADLAELAATLPRSDVPPE